MDCPARVLLIWNGIARGPVQSCNVCREHCDLLVVDQMLQTLKSCSVCRAPKEGERERALDGLGKVHCKRVKVPATCKCLNCQGWIGSDNLTYCLTDLEVLDQTCYLALCTDTWPSSPSIDL